MGQPAIRVNGVWKEYVLGTEQHQHGTFYELLSSVLKRPFGGAGKADKAPRTEEHFWALQDVSFEVQPGEVVGIIGRNGAGKSTLLKILSRITAPTLGEVSVSGRLSSLLEVGTGFHPELSGRENVFLNGAILGMKRQEISRKFHEIVAFAELEKFIDTPVKRYSSGMYVRLAFAVAAHLEPDVLVVDEVLAVGDAAFQERCVGKMHDIRRSGRALLVVSHNIQLVKQLCATAVLLESGRLVAFGGIDEVLPRYFGASGHVGGEWQPSGEVTESFSYRRVRIIPPPGYNPQTIPAFLPFSIEFVFDVSVPAVSGRIALRITDSAGAAVMASANTDALSTFRKVWAVGAHREECTIPANLLVPGRYFLSISKPVDGADVVLENVCTFSVDAAGSLTERDGRLGAIAPMLSWSKD